MANTVPATDRQPEMVWPRQVNLPAGTGARCRRVFVRAWGRRCPYCGAGGIFSGWFSLRERCPGCGTVFEREEGYFLGAYAINLIVALVFGLGGALLLIFATPLSRAPLLWQETIAVGIAVGLPILFFPLSRTLWIALDLTVDPPRAAREQRFRASDMGNRRNEDGDSPP